MDIETFISSLSTLEIIAGIAGVVLFILGITKSGKTKTAGRTMLWIGVVGVALGLVLPLLGYSILGGLGGTTTLTTVTSPTLDNQNKLCAVEDTTITLSAQDKYLSTATGGTHRYRINGAPALTVSDAGTFTASPGDTIEVLWSNASTTSYFSSKDTYTVPCKGTFTPDVKTLSKNGTITVTFFTDPNGDVIPKGNQSLTAGDVKNVKTVLQGAYQRDFPEGLVVVLEFNKTSTDDVILLDRAGGSEMPSTSVPQVHTSYYGTSSSRKAYKLPPMSSNTVYEYTTTIDVDDSISPASALESDVRFTFYPLNYYVDDKNGGAYAGPSPEDEYNAQTRAGTIGAILYVE